MKRFASIVLVFVFIQLFSACKVGRFIIYNFADIDDYKKFENRPLEASSTPYQFAIAENGIAPKSATVEGEKVSFEEFLADHKTVSFLIIRNDTIHYEKYMNGYELESITTSFSMAKSITSLLIGCAIEDGLIQNVSEPIINYIPELKDNGFEKVTIEHLLQMTSGLKYNESYVNPFGDAATYYYGTNLRKALKKVKLDTEPGTEFKYTSGTTQLLGLVLERAIKTKTITQYLQEKIWTPLQMEYDASWSLDRKMEGLEKTFCCINARARDFAKIGRLMLNKGDWNGKQIVSKSWIENSTKVDTTQGSSARYQYQWWLAGEDGAYMAQGILGQFVYVNPAKNLIIVRMGKKYGNTNWRGVFQSLSKLY